MGQAWGGLVLWAGVGDGLAVVWERGGAQFVGMGCGRLGSVGLVWAIQ